MLILSLGACKNQGDSGGNMTSNGYKYIIHDATNGAKPVVGEVVTLDFELKTADGKILDDSRNAPRKPTMAIPAKLDGDLAKNPLLAMVMIMAEGDSASIIVPIDSLPNPPEEFKTSPHIEYVLKVVAIEDEASYTGRMQKEQIEQQAAAAALSEKASKEIVPFFEQYQAGKFKNSKTLDNGLKITYIEDTGAEKPKAGDSVTVQYYGFLKDGTSFDNSFRAGRPFVFKVGAGSVIQGWDLGLPEIPLGSKAMLEIPFDLAYGPNGNPPVIPAKADLIFYIELEKIN